MHEVADALKVAVYHAEIDAFHDELAGLVVQLAGSPDNKFPSCYSALIAHTEAHFSHEERLMRESGFPHAAEHLSEHRQMLQELKRFQNRRLVMARAYISQRLPERLTLHIIRMDSLLAAYLRATAP